MALSKTTIRVRFAGGVDLKQDRKTVMRAKLLAADNVVFEKAVTLAKRNGYESLGTQIVNETGQISGGRALLERDEVEGIYINAHDAFSRLGNDQWQRIGAAESLGLSIPVVARETAEQTSPDAATVAGYRMVAWEDSRGGVWWLLEDSVTGRRITPATQASSTGTRPRVRAVGTWLHTYYAEEAAGQVYVVALNTAAPSATPTPKVLIDDLNLVHPGYDVDALPAATSGFIAWHSRTLGLRIGAVTQSGGIGSPSGGFSSPFDVPTAMVVGPALSIDSSDRVAVAWCDVNTSIRRITVTKALAADLPNTQVLSTGVGITALTVGWRPNDDANGDRLATVFFDEASTTSDPNRDRIVGRLDFTTAPSNTGVTRQRGHSLASHAWGYQDHVYALITHNVPVYATAFAFRDDGAVVARFLHGLAGLPFSTDHLPKPEASADIRSIAVPFRVRVTEGVYSETSIRLARLDHDDPDAHARADINGLTYMAGGLLQVYDGSRFAEAGFHYGIDGEIGVAPSGAGSGIGAGTYVYRVVPVHTLANGIIEEGPPSIGTTVVTTIEDRITLQIPTYRLTNKQGVRFDVYRSENGDDAIFYRISSLDPTATGPQGYVANDPGVDFVTFIDEQADATIIADSSGLLYTSGGLIPPNDPPQTGSIMAAGKNRLFAVDELDPLRVRFTQDFSERPEFAPEWPASFSARVPPEGGPITGLIVLDDAVIATKRASLYFIAGPGPIPDGQGGFTPFERINVDAGCITQRSLVYSPLGVPFQSKKGIYMLGRDRSVKYLGAPVEALNDQTITAATLIEDRNQIRFLTSAGKTLLYDYFHNEWSPWTNHEGRDAAILNGTYHYIRNDGRVLKESPTRYLDGFTQITMRIETAWLHLGEQLQGFQRIWHALLLGTYKSDHQIRVRIGYDYQEGVYPDEFIIEPDDWHVSPIYGDDALYGDSAVYGGPVDSVYQAKIHVGRKCQSVKFVFEDIQAVGEEGAGFELTELLLTCGFARSDWQPGDTRMH